MDQILELTARTAEAYFGHNSVPVSEIGAVMKGIHATLHGLANGNGNAASAERPKPAVPIKNSVQHDYVVCLEDGKKLKMLKRYLRSNYDMTPDQYRARWGLPRDYPMVAPAYAAQRSEFAKKIGLGKHHTTSKKRRTK